MRRSQATEWNIPIVICSADVVEVSRRLPLITGQSHPSDRIGTRRRDASKSAEHTRVPERKGVIPIAPGGTGEDMALPVFDIANLGISHRKKVEEQPTNSVAKAR